MADSFADIACEPDVASKIAAEIMGLRWTYTDTGEERCQRHGQLQEIVAKYLAAPAAKGGMEVPAGWKLVPTEPTTEMRQAANKSVVVNTPDGTWALGVMEADRAYRVMLAASPPPPAGAAGGGSGDLAALSAGDLDTLDWVASELSGKGQTAAAAVVVKAARRASAPTPDLGAQGEPVDSFGAHILDGVIGTIAGREIGPGHVVLSTERYRWLLSHVTQGDPVADRSNDPVREAVRAEAERASNQLSFHKGVSDACRDQYQAPRPGETEAHKIIEAADCIGVRGADWALTIEWPDGVETVEHVSNHGARVLGYEVPNDD